MAADGHRVVLVTATRGELGEVPEGLLGAGESLAERRAVELAAACAVLGVARHEYLGYGDSGMAGEATNEDPACFWQADVEEAAAGWPPSCVDEDADVFVTYDENGGYGHPDHIQVHRVGMRAAERAATPRVFMATVNRDYLLSLAERSDEFGMRPCPTNSAAMLEHLGVRGERITTDVDVHDFLAAEAPGHGGPRQPDHATRRSSSPCRPRPSPRCGAPSGTSESAPNPAPPSRTHCSHRGRDTGGSDDYSPRASWPARWAPCSPSWATCAPAWTASSTVVTDEDARRRLVPSRTTLLGLVKHLTLVEVYWGQRRFAGPHVGAGLRRVRPRRRRHAWRRSRPAYAARRQRTDEILAACATSTSLWPGVARA